MTDLLGEINARTAKNERVLVTTLTKKMAEDLTDFLTEQGIKVKYMHHEVDTFERMEIIKDLRLGSIDVVVAIWMARRRSVSVMARSMLSVTSSAYIMTRPSALRAARPMVWMRLVSLRRKPSLSASRIATRLTTGRSRPSRRRLMPTGLLDPLI